MDSVFLVFSLYDICQWFFVCIRRWISWLQLKSFFLFDLQIFFYINFHVHWYLSKMFIRRISILIVSIITPGLFRNYIKYSEKNAPLPPSPRLWVLQSHRLTKYFIAFHFLMEFFLHLVFWSPMKQYTFLNGLPEPPL